MRGACGCESTSSTPAATSRASRCPTSYLRLRGMHELEFRMRARDAAQRFDRLRYCDVDPLRVFDADVGETGEHLGGLDALGDGLDAHRVTDLRDRLDHAAVDVIGGHVLNELAVDLQVIDRKILQVHE